MNNHITVIGGGLAGCEAAWQIAQRGVKVKLYEMKPEKYSPAHSMQGLAEIVCSNSFKSNSPENAAGLLKEELRIMNSLIISCADKTKVPAGQALAVDREKFSELVTKEIEAHPNIEIIRKEIGQIPDEEIVIISTGPLTSEALSEDIKKRIGNDYLHFYDAAAPIVSYDSIDMEKAFRADRYGKGDNDYINCPMERDEYERFYTELIKAKTIDIHGFEDKKVFEGCMPVEVMAKRGIQTLAFGPMKPVGFINPKTGKQPYAVVQLRQDNTEGTLFNMVGFQTNLKWGEQKRIFSMIPGLENSEFVRYGVMHRNTYINSPQVLTSAYNLRNCSGLFFAGQITGVEGYVESAASGLIAGINAVQTLLDRELIIFPRETVMGALTSYISSGSIGGFQPMNANFGIIPSAEKKMKKDEKNKFYSDRSIKKITQLIKEISVQ
ncbi:MAG: methylenetetrahydrofolate--tRNA-(uracil(54)-C(5))-methyltransferase (FADH(2)-oxidizing) TrmFO [Deltaproteobacteria bacterium]